MSNSEVNRRQFLKMSGLTLLVSVAAPNLLSNVFAAETKKEPLPPGATPVSETDPVASAVGYKADVSKIDFKRYPKRKLPDAKNQRCKNCALYTPANGSWGKCQLLTSGLVNADGWCGSWSKKA
ncbi:MAG: high-potential iron-sulfur protein [Bdellovibrionia bacterium]